MGRRLSVHDLLESLLLPSKVIAEGYATTEIETNSGEIVSGRVEREDGQLVVVRPLAAFQDAVTLRKADIRHRALSKVSNMPTGIVNSLEEKQILDLLAYLISDGNAEYVAFRR